MRMTEEQYSLFQANRNRQAAASQAVPKYRGRAAANSSAKARPRPKHTPGAMNKTEEKYQNEVLEPGIHAGRYRSAKFESVKLRLADKTFYTPDFQVVNDETGEIELHEVKGHWEDDARVKIKVAAAQYPEYRFIAIMHKKGEWTRELF